VIKLPSGDIDLLAIGETVIDLISQEETDDLAEAMRFRKYLGGSPANIAVHVAKLGGKSAVVSKIGAGAGGVFVRRQLKKSRVMTDYLRADSFAHTTMILVARSQRTPDFVAYREADFRLTAAEIPADAITRAKVVHASTFALSREPCRSAVEKAFQLARAQKKIVSLDPNYSPRIWPDREEAQAVLHRLLPYATLTKPSWDDAVRLFGAGKTERAYIDLFHRMGPSVVLLTLGRRGALLSTPEGITAIPSRPIRIADATGAGDAFWAGFIVALLDGHTCRESALFAREVVERKLATIGPLPDFIDRQQIYDSLARLQTVADTPL